MNFVFNLKRYWKFILYSAKFELKAEMAGSYLNWIWWLIEPFSLMLIYTFIFGNIFSTNNRVFPLFVFVGITMWNFFMQVIVAATSLIRDNRSIISKQYIPKYVLLISKMVAVFYRTFFSILFIVVMQIMYRIEITITMLFSVFIWVSFVFFTMAIALFVVDICVYILDMQKAVVILLNVYMYACGIFYSIQNIIPEPYNKFILYGNPVAYFIDIQRALLIENQMFDWNIWLVWFAISFLLLIIGLKIVSIKEKEYVRCI